MAFNSTKSAGDTVFSADWNAFVDFTELISSNTYGHSSNADLHFPSSNLISWLDDVYAQSGSVFDGTNYMTSANAISRFPGSSNIRSSFTTDNLYATNSYLGEIKDKDDNDTQISFSNREINFHTSGIMFLSLDGSGDGKYGFEGNFIVGNPDYHHIDFYWLDPDLTGIFRIDVDNNEVAIGHDSPNGYTLNVGGSIGSFYAHYISGGSIQESILTDKLDNNYLELDGTNANSNIDLQGYSLSAATVSANKVVVKGDVFLSGVPGSTDDTVLIKVSDGSIATDEIDSRVWGNTLVSQEHGIDTYVAVFNGTNSITIDKNFAFINPLLKVPTISSANGIYTHFISANATNLPRGTDVAWSGASEFYTLSSNYYGHSSNKDIHFPSSSIINWLDNVYEQSGSVCDDFNSGWALVSSQSTISHNFGSKPNIVSITPSGNSPFGYSVTYDSTYITIYLSVEGKHYVNWFVM